MVPTVLNPFMTTEPDMCLHRRSAIDWGISSTSGLLCVPGMIHVPLATVASASPSLKWHVCLSRVLTVAAVHWQSTSAFPSPSFTHVQNRGRGTHGRGQCKSDSATQETGTKGRETERFRVAYLIDGTVGEVLSATSPRRAHALAAPLAPVETVRGSHPHAPQGLFSVEAAAGQAQKPQQP